jgi:HNH endonuclease
VPQRMERGSSVSVRGRRSNSVCVGGTNAYRGAVAERKRKTIGPKMMLEVFKRDGYTCQICGRSPAFTPGLELEVDHREPFSKGGADSLDNYQTLCQRCNRGKGNSAELNRAIAADIDALLDQINPEIRPTLSSSGATRVVANHEDFVQLARSNEALTPPMYRIALTTNTVVGYGAGGRLGIYTVRDSGGPKAVFDIAVGHAVS